MKPWERPSPTVLHSIRPTDRVALALVIGAAAAIVVGAPGSSWSDWLPNIATDAIALAVTIAIVDRIVRREERERNRPRTQRVHYQLGFAWRSLVEAVAIDYAETHSAGTFNPIPNDADQLLAQWLAGHKDEDIPAQPPDSDHWHPWLLNAADEFAAVLRRYRTTDLDVLEPDLVAAIDDFQWRLGHAIQFVAAAERGHLVRDDIGARSRAIVVEATQEFGRTLRRYDDRWLPLPDLMIQGTTEHHAHYARHGPPAPAPPRTDSRSGDDMPQSAKRLLGPFMRDETPDAD